MKNVIVFLIVLFVLNSQVLSQELGQWRWSEQKFMEAPFDNSLHFGTGILPNIFEYGFKMKWWQADLMAIGLGVLYEVKDGLCPYEIFGYWGGEGFSFMDLQNDIIGVGVNRLLNYTIRIGVKRKNENKRINKSFRYY